MAEAARVTKPPTRKAQYAPVPRGPVKGTSDSNCLLILNFKSHGNLGALHTMIKRIKDSSNLIAGEQKFIHWALTLKANGQKAMTPKMST